jgi:trehalose 6-phosphate synthase
MCASGGVWIAHGSGTADRIAVDAGYHARVPPEGPAYSLRRVLSTEIEREYYYEFANQAIWPSCHIVYRLSTLRRRGWESYQRANKVFAEAILEEANGHPAFVFVPGYHFGLLPRILKRANPQLTVPQFWHIPWLPKEVFRTFPWRRELLQALGNDRLGLQLPCHCSNFREAINSNLEPQADDGHIRRHDTVVGAFPISIDFDEQGHTASRPEVAIPTEERRALIGQEIEILGVGIDRIDYVKGMAECFETLRLWFQERPDCIGRLTFVQVGVPSRTEIRDYHELNNLLCERVEEINSRWACVPWKPIILICRHLDPKFVRALHLMVDICIINPLHDGLNLVGKQFVVSRIDQDGVLILSVFAEAAEKPTHALIGNSLALDEIASAVHGAISMEAMERHRRMMRMRRAVANLHVYRWAAKFVLALSAIGASIAARGTIRGRWCDTEVA